MSNIYLNLKQDAHLRVSFPFFSFSLLFSSLAVCFIFPPCSVYPMLWFCSSLHEQHLANFNQRAFMSMNFFFRFTFSSLATSLFPLWQRICNALVLFVSSWAALIYLQAKIHIGRYASRGPCMCWVCCLWCMLALGEDMLTLGTFYHLLRPLLDVSVLAWLDRLSNSG